MDELREKIVSELIHACEDTMLGNAREEATRLADRILAIPEIAEGQRLRVKFETQRRTVELEQASGTRTVLGHSISTNPPR